MRTQVSEEQGVMDYEIVRDELHGRVSYSLMDMRSLRPVFTYRASPTTRGRYTITGRHASGVTDEPCMRTGRERVVSFVRGKAVEYFMKTIGMVA